MNAAGPLQLRQGPLQMDLLPVQGARCDALRWQPEGAPAAVDLLRPQSVGAGEVLHSACFALLPYSNRLFGGRLIAHGKSLTLPANLDRLAVPVHGLGWRTAWTVSACSANNVRLRYEHAGDIHWPFAHDASQTITLCGNEVRFTLALHNRGTEPMPAGLGWHPCFATDPQTLVRIDATHVWKPDHDGLPGFRVATAGDPVLDFQQPRSPDAVVLNHCLEGWSGPAAIFRRRQHLTLHLSASDNLRHMGRLDHGTVGGQIGADVERVEQAMQTLEHVHVEMAPGDALFFHANLLHASGRNDSEHPRNVLLSCFSRADNAPYKSGPAISHTPLGQLVDGDLSRYMGQPVDRQAHRHRNAQG